MRRHQSFQIEAISDMHSQIHVCPAHNFLDLVKFFKLSLAFDFATQPEKFNLYILQIVYDLEFSP